ncbi:MAG TPA: galactokinase [Firmicutes bacterium]|jgi:galactokinase|nr:galactokinase [Bacillota bacterium]
MNSNDHLLNLFQKIYGPGGEIISGRAPGRVNLIGEHTDYNEGYVFPMAIEFEIKMAIRKRKDSIVRVYAVDYDQLVEVSLNKELTCNPQYQGCNYPLAVLWALNKNGIKLPGMEIAFSGNIPLGAGLSSSAALEVATAKVVQKLTDFSMDPVVLAKLCQFAENEFIGAKCGIMDQFVSMMGREEHALFLDCRSLDYQHIPLNLGAYSILICHSGVKHSLVDSEYNIRRRQCEEGVEILTTRFPQIRALRDVKLEQLENCHSEMNPAVYRCCRHVINENNRVLESIEALRRQDLISFGQLMNASHDSLRDDFEVSCAEIDLLVDLARQVPEVLGARITGGGFGGCTVNLLPARQEERFMEYVRGNYLKQTGIEPEFYISSPANGAEVF